jgi:hypothetical protein
MNTNTNPADHYADMTARFRPSDAAIAVAADMATGTDDAAYAPILLPGKVRSIWTAGQVVLSLPVAFPTRGEAVAYAEGILGEQAGTVAYAAVYGDGTWAVWEW